MSTQFVNRSLLVGGLLLGSFGAPSCSHCTDSGMYGLTIRVTDESSGQLICDAAVIATDGKYSEKLIQQGSPDCVYLGASERAGTYNVTASRDGYLPKSVQVRVTEGECHVDGQSQTIALTPVTSDCSPGDIVACACGDGGVQGSQQCGSDGKFGPCEGC